MAALTALMTHFCTGEDSWLAHRIYNTSDPGTSEARDGNGRPQRNKHKRRNNKEKTEDTAVNAGFSGSKHGQRRSHSKEIGTVHLIWTKYLTDLARFMAPPTSLQIIPTETVGSLNRPVS